MIFGISDDNQVVGLDDPKGDADKISETIKTRLNPIPEFKLGFNKTEEGKVAFFVFGKDVATIIVLCMIGLNVFLGREEHRLQGLLLMIPFPVLSTEL